MNFLRSCALAGLVLGMGCREEPGSPGAAPGVPVSKASPEAAAPAPRTSSVSDFSPQAPQPKLQTIKLWLGTNEVSAEIAATSLQIATGMMWRTNMAEMEGMLFIFPSARQVSFYMRNTLLPLSCAYIDAEGTVLEIYDMKPRDETPIPSASDQVQYVLEMNQGWFQRHGVAPGTVVSTQFGPLRETFFRRRN